jgi:phosphoribosylaminoimidazolecarboxamide formyltransferase/IMP cyclohydrolase
MKKRALISVSDKTGLEDLALGLTVRDYELVSTGGTAVLLASQGFTVTRVSDVTGFPEMLDGRVKTLHPGIFGGILARRNRPDDLESIAKQGIELFDIVIVNLYPFAKAAKNPTVGFDQLIEEIDIGGPSLIRAAAKNFKDVLIVVEPRCYGKLLNQLSKPGGPSNDFRLRLMRRAFKHTASYDTRIAIELCHNTTITDDEYIKIRAAGSGRE